MNLSRQHAARILSEKWTSQSRAGSPSVRLESTRFRLCPVEIPRPDRAGSDFLEDLQVRDQSERILAQAIAELPEALRLLCAARCPNHDCHDGQAGVPVQVCCQKPDESGECCGDPDLDFDLEPCEWCARREALIGVELLRDLEKIARKRDHE